MKLTTCLFILWFIHFFLSFFFDKVNKGIIKGCWSLTHSFAFKGRRGCGRMVVGFTTTCAISAYHHYSCEFEPRSWRGVLKTTLCDKVCQCLVTGQWFSLGNPVTSTNKTDRHKIFLNVKHHKPNQPLLHWKHTFLITIDKNCFLFYISFHNFNSILFLTFSLHI